MKKRIVSTILALFLCVSVVPSSARAWQEWPAVDSSTSEAVLYADFVIPSPQQAYEIMTALQATYKEGMTWTDDTPYGSSNPYRWKGGTNEVGTGCAAFAFLLSDEVFGNLPARIVYDFSFEDVRAGDILRVNNKTHSVIVLQVSEAGVILAEANYNSSVHWGRVMPKSEVEAADFLMTRYPAGYVDPDDPTANDPVEGGSGTLDGGLTWTLTNAGTLTISGTGPMPDYSTQSEQPWSAYADKILRIVIEDGVTAVGSSAFWGCSALSVSLPGSVSTIGNSAFRASSLIGVTVPGSVSTIGDSAFRECKNLTSTLLSEGVTEIDGNAFQGCIELSAIEFPASVKAVGAGAFANCVKLERAVFSLSSNEVSLGENLFTQCWELAEVVLPQKMNDIGTGMFQKCYYALSSLTIPQGVTEIRGSAFASCSSLAWLAIPDSVTNIGSAALSDCASLKDIYFGGNEAQWNSIGKSEDVQKALSAVTVHYNSDGPSTTPDPGPGTDPEPGPGVDPGPGVNPDPGVDPDPGPAPDPVPDPGIGLLPDIFPLLPDQTPVSSVPAAPDPVEDTVPESPAASIFGETLEVTPEVAGAQAAVKVDSASLSAIAAAPGSGSASIRVEAVQSGVNGVIFDLPAAGLSELSAAGKTLRVEAPIASLTLSKAAEAALGDGTDVTISLQKEAAGGVTVGILSGGQPQDVQYRVHLELPNGMDASAAVIVMTDDNGQEHILRGSAVTGQEITALVEKGSAHLKIVENRKEFADTAGHWADQDGAIRFVSSRELMEGTAEGVFSPDAEISRAMIVTALYRLSGEVSSPAAAAFRDVDPASWYSEAVSWGAGLGIVTGVDGTSFAPDQSVTREQLAVFLYRAAKEFGEENMAAGSLSAFRDAASVSGYAREAVAWCVGLGIINGSGGELDPAGLCTRGQAAAMLARFVKHLLGAEV